MNLRRMLVRHFHIKLLLLAPLIYVGYTQAAFAGDPEAGNDVFASECSDCQDRVKTRRDLLCLAL